MHKKEQGQMYSLHKNALKRRPYSLYPFSHGPFKLRLPALLYELLLQYNTQCDFIIHQYFSGEKYNVLELTDFVQNTSANVLVQ